MIVNLDFVSERRNKWRVPMSKYFVIIQLYHFVVWVIKIPQPCQEMNDLVVYLGRARVAFPQQSV